jgi:hypothetical protein
MFVNFISNAPTFMLLVVLLQNAVKQRLREEVESPVPKVRLAFFGGSAGSALIAAYFSALSTIKAVQGGYSDAPPLDVSYISAWIVDAVASFFQLFAPCTNTVLYRGVLTFHQLFIVHLPTGSIDKRCDQSWCSYYLRCACLS